MTGTFTSCRVGLNLFEFNLLSQHALFEILLISTAFCIERVVFVVLGAPHAKFLLNICLHFIDHPFQSLDHGDHYDNLKKGLSTCVFKLPLRHTIPPKKTQQHFPGFLPTLFCRVFSLPSYILHMDLPAIILAPVSCDLQLENANLLPPIDLVISPLTRPSPKYWDHNGHTLSQEHQRHNLEQTSRRKRSDE